MRLFGLEKIKNVYFIGVYGISMSALAKFLTTLGYCVSGSDACKNEEAESLAFYGVKTFIGIDENRIELKNADLIVYTDAIPNTHPELVFAYKLQKKVLKRAELLEIICRAFPHTIAVAGSHGKTTCTSMCAHILKAVNAKFTAHIGGEDLTFGNFYSSGNDFFLTEACEYKKNILKIKADTAVLLNIDSDHMECYNDEKELLDTFKTYCLSAKTAFVCADNSQSASLGDFPSFGIVNSFADYRAVDIKAVDERYGFTIEEYGKPICKIRLNAIGKCNIYNALASFAMMRSIGFHEKEIKNGLESFIAVKRRFEKLGNFYGASFICDYAHHPKEILSTLATAKSICKRNLYVVFQPHTYSRTKLLLQDFISALHPIENLMIYKTYSARERYDPEGSGTLLAKKLGALYAENIFVLRTWLSKTVKEGDTVLFLGAGDIFYVAQYLIKELR